MTETARRYDCRRATALLVLGLLATLVPATAWGQGLSFDDTVWQAVAERSGVEPALLYALALAESGRNVGASRRTPWPWVIRTPTGGYWFDSASAARRGLEAVRARWPDKRIDVGAAQINLGWHRQRFDEPARLLELDYNLEIAARILVDSVTSTADPVLGIGRYHHWSDRRRSQTYGQRVWSYYRRIAFADRRPGEHFVVATQQRLSELVDAPTDR